MISVIQHTRPRGARRVTALALAAASVVGAAAPAFAQYSGGGVQDPSVFASNLLTWLQPLLTAIAISVTIVGCAMASSNPRAIGGIVGAGVGAIGLIWGLPYAPTAMGILGSAVNRL